MTDIKNISTNFWDDQEDMFDEDVESVDWRRRRRRDCNINIFCRRGCRIFIRCGRGGFSVDSECDECQ